MSWWNSVRDVATGDFATSSKVLEGAGLIVSRVDGAKRPRRLAAAGIEAMDQWLAMLRTALEKKLRPVGRSSGRYQPEQEWRNSMSK